jgi:acyl-CoA thioester hydrolase
LHVFDLTVYFADTDAGGVVYHARYLEFFERARFELFQTLDPGCVIPDFSRGGFVVSRMAIEFRRPARLGDRVRIETRLKELRRASFVLTQRAISAVSGELFCEAEATLVKVNAAFKPEALPERVRAGLSA